MNARTVDLLAAFDPISNVQRVPTGVMGVHRSPSLAQGIERFLARYRKTNFGWYIAQQYARHGMPFPVPLYKRDLWVIKAYMMRVDPSKYWNETISDAYHIAQRSHGVAIGDMMLKTHILAMSRAGTVEEQIKMIAERVGCSTDLVEAYECLFFNILDRRMDAIYITQEVYPETRIVEFHENYLHSAALIDLVKRSGFNTRDPDYASYLLGIGDQSYLAKIASRPDRESELTKYMMGNGLMLTRANLLNQRSIGMTRVSNLLAASRQGGTQADVPVMEGLVSNLASELTSALHLGQEQTAELMRQDAASLTLDVESDVS